MNLGNLVKNIYNGNISINTAKQNKEKWKICLKVLLNTIQLRINIKTKK